MYITPRRLGEVRSPAEVDTSSRATHRYGSAHWGATCPRQGSLLPPIPVHGDTIGPSSGLSSADSRHQREKRMPRRLTPQSTLENLKREAKRWLRAVHDNIADARARLERAVPDAPAIPTLRDIQHALAREHGLPGWGALKTRLAQGGSFRASPDDLVNRFLDNACPDHHVRGGPDHVRAQHTAMRLLGHYPEIAHASFHTDVVCGELAAVERALGERAALASLRSDGADPDRERAGGSGDVFARDLGPKGWEPLLYLCFTRLSLPAVNANAVTIARSLLDHGASPNAHFMAGESRYTPLVGVIG